MNPSLDVGLVLVDRHDLWQQRQAATIPNDEIVIAMFDKVNGRAQVLTTASCRRAGPSCLEASISKRDPDIH